MRHPTGGVLHRLLDEPAGVGHCDREHVAGCPQCLDELAWLREDAAVVGPVRAAQPRARRSGGLLRRPAVAALAVAVALTGAGTAAANDWLQIFRTEQITPLRLSTADLIALPDLSGYGQLELTSAPDVHEVPDAATAAAQSGLDVPQVTDLPRGVTGQPVYQVGRQAGATFTFSAQRAAQTAAQHGSTLPPPPAGLDGSPVRLLAGPGVAQLWPSSTGAPALIVGRAVAPTAFSTGVPFATARDYLLSLPGLPDDVAAQLRTFTAHGTTLPLPVPADEITTSTAQIDGTSATVLETRDRTLAAVLWVDDGIVTAVAGSLDTDEVLSIARTLQ